MHPATESFKVVRDQSFDLDEKNEFLRPNFAYPQTLEELENQRIYLASRKRVPNGFVDATYSVSKWYRTNQWRIPVAAEFMRNVYGGNSVTYPADNIKLRVDQITMRDGTITAPELSDQTFVRDFRYTRRENARMYRYAEYVQSGAWKSADDPKLKAEQEYYLKHGPKLGDFGFLANFLDPGRKSNVILVWIVLILVQVVAITMLIRSTLKTKK